MSDTVFKLVSSVQKSGVAYWRVYFQDPRTGKRLKPSTGVVDDGTRLSWATAREAAKLIVSGRSHTVEILPAKGSYFGELVNWLWDWDGDYLRARRARDPLAVTREHAASMASLVRVHILPYVVTAPGPSRGRRIVDLTVDQVTADVLDGLVTDKLEAGLSSQTVKHLIHAISPAFDLSVRRRMISESPIPLMLPFTPRSRVRDAFTFEEVRALLDPATLDKVWGDPDARRPIYRDGTRMHGLAVLLAATAARFGAVIALHADDIEKSDDGTWYAVRLDQSVGQMSGLKDGTKTGKGTLVPVAAEIIDKIRLHWPKEGPLFPGRGGTGFLLHRTAVNKLHEALRRIGVEDEEQRRRLLGWHSFRHMAVTRMRSAGVPKDVRRAFSEHRQDRTEDGYTHLGPADLVAALPVQRSLIG